MTFLKVCVIGTGYVGLVTGTCLAEMGNRVCCVDTDENKIRMLKQGKIPLYEPGLTELVQKNIKEKRLSFCSKMDDCLKDALYCFIAVGTPSLKDGSADLKYVLQVADTIGELLDHYMLIINKSTVPVGTANLVRDRIQEKLRKRNKVISFDIASNPEFLKEGNAIEDFMRPDRIVIGTDNAHAAKLMKRLYEPFVRNHNPILFMDIPSSEITKYASNAMLATRISFMNEMARLCDKVGADVSQVRAGVGTDKRIGMPFLYAGAGYGGSCFPKDVKEIVHTGRRHGVEMNLLKAVDQVNEEQKLYIVNLVIRHFGDNLAGKHFALWGLAFKPQTDDMREAPSLTVIKELLKRGAQVTAYDPEAMNQAELFLKGIDNIFYSENMMDALEQKDGLILLTEWRQFQQPDFLEIKEQLKEAIIFDGRNIYDAEQLEQLGFEYYCIGRNGSKREA